MVVLPFAYNSITVLSFCGGVWASSMSILVEKLLTSAFLQATEVTPLGLLLKPHIPEPSPHVHWQTLLSG